MRVHRIPTFVTSVSGAVLVALLMVVPLAAQQGGGGQRGQADKTAKPMPPVPRLSE